MKPDKHSKVTPDRLMQLTWGYAPPLIIEAAVKHRFFDLLEAGAEEAKASVDLFGRYLELGIFERESIACAVYGRLGPYAIVATEASRQAFAH